MDMKAVAQFIDQIAIVIRFKIPIKDYINRFCLIATNVSVWGSFTSSL